MLFLAVFPATAGLVDVLAPPRDMDHRSSKFPEPWAFAVDEVTFGAIGDLAEVGDMTVEIGD